MSIHGVGPAGPVPVPSQPPRDRVAGGDVDVESPQGAPLPAPPETLGVAALAPPGTDPALWSVLTSEERAYFEQVHALGPITYGPQASSQEAQLPRGSRLDVKV